MASLASTAAPDSPLTHTSAVAAAIAPAHLKSPRDPDQDLEMLAQSGCIARLRLLPLSAFSNADAVSSAALKAAGHGRVRVLEFLERKATIDPTAALAQGVLGDRVETVRYYQNKGIDTCTDGTVSIALHHDCARVLAYWLEQGLLKDITPVAHRAVHYDALHCFRQVARLDFIANDASLMGLARHGGKKRIGAYMNAAAMPETKAATSAIIGTLKPVAQAWRRALKDDGYTYLTPSHHIDVDKTTIPFLLYRRAARLVLLRKW